MTKIITTFLTFFGLAAIYLLTWPVPVKPVAWEAPVDNGLIGEYQVNNKLSDIELLSIAGEEGPEDFAVSPDGKLFFSLLGGKVMYLNEEGNAVEYANTQGRPLGLEFSPAGDLYVADAFKGLLKIAASDQSIEVLANSLMLENGEESAIRYADDLDLTSDGVIYFSDASTRFAAEVFGTFDASMLDIMEHSQSGRVLKYDPVTKQTTQIMDGIQFANGVAVSHDEQFILVNETGKYRILKHWIAGDEKGKTEVFVENLPGFPDNLNKSVNDGYWLGLVAPRNKLLDLMSPYPEVRTVVQRMPPALKPKADLYGHVVKLNEQGEVLISLQDTNTIYSYTTGAIELDGWLYVSSLHEKVLGRLPLSAF